MPEAYRYIFRSNSGMEIDFEYRAWINAIEDISGLDEVLINVCAGREGVSTPGGKFLRLPAVEAIDGH